MTVVVLACLVAVAFAHTQYEYQPAEETMDIPSDAAHGTPENLRPKRSLLLLKKKLLLGKINLSRSFLLYYLMMSRVVSGTGKKNSTSPFLPRMS
jgi:hypothetical protein